MVDIDGNGGHGWSPRKVKEKGSEKHVFPVQVHEIVGLIYSKSQGICNES